MCKLARLFFQILRTEFIRTFKITIWVFASQFFKSMPCPSDLRILAMIGQFPTLSNP